MISGKTLLVAHVGYPTGSFKAPLIYNPWFESRGIDAVVVPMGCRAEDCPEAVWASERVLSLPLFVDMTEEDVVYAATALREVLRAHAR